MIGKTIAQYRVLEKLGGGGMGVVYRAEDVNLGRNVALKFLPDRLLSDPKALEHFENEARAASLLNHPNICSIYEIEEFEGKPFLVMEYLEGEDLKRRLAGGTPLPSFEVFSIGTQIADALEAAHNQGVIHRDIKPANIFLSNSGRVRLLDFGLAKMADEIDEEMGGRGPVIAADDLSGVAGTTAYMSPEQIRKEELDARSDIFSFGVVLYEMATGKKPFIGKNAAQTMKAILHDKPVSPLALNPELPDGLSAVLGKALEKQREQRYEDAGDVRTDLQLIRHQHDSALQNRHSLKAAAKYQHTFRRGTVQHSYLQMVVAIFLAAVLLAVTVYWAHILHPPKPPEPGRNQIAVLPFENLGAPEDEKLEVTIADTVQNILLKAPQVQVHPVGDPARFRSHAVIPSEAGHELKVGTVVTGHILRDRENLFVTVEAIETKSGKLVWQSAVRAGPSQNLGALLQAELTHGLLPKL